MAEHKHGSMDISAQEKTFENFMTFTTRMCIALALFALFLAVFAV